MTSATHSVEIPVLGIRTRFRSNDERVIDIARRAFGAWSRAILPEDSDPGIDVHIERVPGDENGDDAPVPRFEMPVRSRVELRTAGSSGVADAGRRRVDARVTGTLLHNAQHFRYSVLEALTLALLTRLDRQPFHAAALVHDHTAVLLAGPSGTGKSTLAWAAARTGRYALLAEDVVYVQSSTPRLWGLPGFLHLPPSARSHFPELSAVEPVLRANGKWKLAIDAFEAGILAARPYAEDARIVTLARHDGAPQLQALSADQLAHTLFAHHEQGFDVFAETIADAMKPFTRAGGWRLTLGPDPGAALPLLDALLP